MAKRNAAAELNHDNWDQPDDDKEEAGTFVPLSKEQLQNRVIRKARRSINANSSTNSSSSVSSPFAQFSGFSSSSTASPFQKADNPLLAKSPQTTNGKPSENVDQRAFGNPDNKQLSSSAAMSQPKASRNLEYYRQLQSLNEGVLKWMQLHLVKNTCCDFSPVFNDYKKHLDTLNVTYPVQKKEEASLLGQDLVFKQPSQCFAKGNNSKESPICKKEQNDDDSEYGAHFKSNTTNTQTFSFGINRTPTSTSSGSASGPTSSSKEENNQNKSPEIKNSAQFSSSFFSKTNSDSKSFTFSATTPSENSIQSPGFFGKAYQPANDSTKHSFTFVSATNDKSTGGTNADQGEEYVPPKNEFVAVSEEEAFYSKRCKLFFKKDEAYAEKGVGTLHLKSLEGRTQLLIRADTSLGNILLNIMLSASLPISRTGKNNVLLVCIPNPPVDAKNPDSKEAIPVLIRVKTSEDADELLEKLNQSKS